MRAMKKRKWVALLGTIIILLLSAGIAVATTVPQSVTAPAAQATRTPTPKPTATPTPKTGRITGSTVNVRSRPGTTTTIVGKLKRGDRVQITGQRPGWFEIVYPSGSTRRAWVSAGLIALVATPTATPRPGAIAAPVLLDYQPPNILWKWNGENVVRGQDWYFDIVLMHSSDNQTYETIQADPADAVKSNGIWSFAQPKPVLCETTMSMAIAARKNGEWAAWISPWSNGIKIGGPCDCNDPCPGCGDGGCAN
jgi:Bacterial SH3 domain